MAKILYVVHRYAPFPGGSENYVRDMAEETLRRGHDVVVFAGEHKGVHNGVVATSDPSIFQLHWDLVVVHGGDVAWQDNILVQCKKIQAPVLFMLIVPSESEVYKYACQNVKYVGCSTFEDWYYIRYHGVKDKAVQVRHGIDPKISMGYSGFREKYGIKTKYMFVSAGGYWPNKAHHELVDTFNKIERDDITLVLTGYDNRHNLMPKESEFVKPFMIDDREDVMSAIHEADLYIMNSHKEGFGLVILESMFNKTPWAARNMAGPRLLSQFGFTYENDDELLVYMKNFTGVNKDVIEDAYEYVTLNHMISNTVDDILRLI